MFILFYKLSVEDQETKLLAEQAKAGEMLEIANEELASANKTLREIYREQCSLCE
jgi:hypothetical protein